MNPRAIVISVICAYLLLGAWAFSMPIVVLPDRFAGAEVIVANSPAYKSLVAQNNKLAKQLRDEQAAREKLAKAVDKELQAKDAEIAKLQAQVAASHKSGGFWSVALGILQIGVNFFLNPLGYVMQTLVGIVEALVAVFVTFILVRFLYHKLKK